MLAVLLVYLFSLQILKCEMKIQDILLSLEKKKISQSERETYYDQLYTTLKQPDDKKIVDFCKNEMWRFLQVILEDIEDETL